ncbi:hypothetical protein [Streptomyces sp. NPDC048551]|uniref:hypothetical protein n=1 Tax=Streptomyces sp. NPDC048551 TaxID=3155758 RepID=UPI0034393DBF
MTKTLGACGAAAVLALAAPGTAQAANGILIIDGAAHHNPSGCYALGDFAPPRIANLTDEVASVWSGPLCDGRVTQLVGPGRTAIGLGRSAYVP